jgi:hypothetical protein
MRSAPEPLSPLAEDTVDAEARGGAIGRAAEHNREGEKKEIPAFKINHH